MNLGTIRLRGRPRNRWQDEVREDERIVGREGWQEKVRNREEWKNLLRTARNRTILHMPMELTPSVVCPEMFRGFNYCLYCYIPEVLGAAFSAHYGHARNIPGLILFMLKWFICCVKDNSTFPISF